MIPPQLGALAEDDADAADVAHAVAHRVHAQRANGARVGRQQSRQQLDRGALAGAVRARVGDDLAAFDGQVDAAQRLDASHLGTQEVAHDVAQPRRALTRAVHLPHAAQLNYGVPREGSVWILFGHSASAHA